MKLCTFEVATHLGRYQRLGAALPSGVIDLNFAYAAHLQSTGERRPQPVAELTVPSSMLEFLRGGENSFKAARYAIGYAKPGRKGPNDETLFYRPEEIRLRTPLPRPPSVRDFFGFEQHVKAGFERRGEPMPQEWYEIPVYYQTGHHNIIGTEEDVIWPSFTEKFDYELELAAVIGKEGTNIPADQAASYIAGFTIMNDFSARDIQRKEMKVRLGPAKGKHWCTGLGPWIVTRSEIADPYRLKMAARVNGQQWSEGNSGDMFWKFEQMIEFLTQDDTIYPGDVIGSGTVGTGCGLELNRWVKPGDVIELEIEGIGILRNRVTK